MPETDITRAPQVWKYEDIATGGDTVRALLADRKINLHPNSALSRLLKQATRLSKEWQAGIRATDGRTLMHASNANRVIRAVTAAAEYPESFDCLKRIAGNDMDLSQRAVSQGKDALWEIELFAMLKARSISSRLAEPDIVADFGLGEYSIACKKVYSNEARAVESQIRAGVKQIARSGRPGIVAINVDDLVPADVFVRFKTDKRAMDALAGFNRAFIDLHRPKAQRFLARDGCDGILVSVSVPSEIEQSKPSFNNLVQMTLWSMETASIDSRARLGLMQLYFKDIAT